MTDTLLSLAVLAAFALIGGGVWALVKRRGRPFNAWLMIGAALALLVNVWANSAPV